MARISRSSWWDTMPSGYLAAANVLFLAAFLVASPASALLSSEQDPDALGEVSVPVPPGPVVVIVFDEGDEQFEIGPGALVVVPTGVARGMVAETRLAFVAAKFG